MNFQAKYTVLMLICVLVSWNLAQETNVESAPCDISIQDDNSVILNCSRRNISEIPDNWPERINSLDKDGHVLIRFFNNSITNLSQLPPVMGTRVALIFKCNEIVDIEDDAFSNIEGLVYLDLSNNNITGDVLRSEIFRGRYIDGLYATIALETLILAHNDIHSLDRYLFQYTPNLIRLYLNNNPIEIIDHVTSLALSSATNLEVLDLSNTDIDHIPLDTFRGLTKIQMIDLSHNRFVTVPESLSLVGSTLQYLTFNDNNIVELNDDSFIGLTNLIQLEVGENDYLDEVKRSTFSPLKNLKVLHLCHNQNLKYISHNAFRGLKEQWTLREVYLDDNNLSELSTDLMPWNKLEILGMTGNNWLCNCDLVDIVSKKGAGLKFKTNEIPFCAAPMRFSGTYVTNVTLTYCPTFDSKITPKQKYSLSNLKPKHVLWSILGVAAVACFGMLLGLLIKSMKSVYNNRFRSQPIQYININSDSSYA
ncbi:unnamed protein product [Arctia plantaginis]|uniref:Uncharacterized protein n=1 Tax=Arctia plantaginis TaxID=874455 RepID=A0A8S1B3U4_ARCPL|nr:unnamed protein product [Arctia plantaginis]